MKSSEPDVRTQILQAANHFFSQRGYEGTSLQLIAEEVGIRKPSLLYHFPSKDALRLAVLARVTAHWNEVLPRLLQVATSGEGRFDALVGEVVSFFTENPDRARLLMREFLDRPEEIKTALRSHLAPWMAILSDYIRRGQSDDILQADVDPEAYLVNVIQMVIGGVAVSDLFDSFFEEGDGEGRFARQIEEVVRMARASLFCASAEQRD
jgi:AcrR family transcriptional regulator